jgi:hypothetical protein
VTDVEITCVVKVGGTPPIFSYLPHTNNREGVEAERERE